MEPKNYIDTIVLMAHRLMVENPALQENEAIEKATQNYLDGLIEFGEKLAAIKEELVKEDWQLFIKTLASKKTSEELQFLYDQMLVNNQLLDGMTITELGLSVEYEGMNVQRTFPAGTKIKISKDIWDEGNDYVEVWAAPNSVDYTLRQNILAL